MGNFCQMCGQALVNGSCPNCTNNANNANNNGVNVNINVDMNNQNSYQAPTVIKRDVATAIILSFVTCGIYGLYWVICMNNDVNKVSGENEPSSGLLLLLTIVTCGVYFIYWNYKVGKKMAMAGKRYNKEVEDNSILFLLLSIFGFGIINYCIIQTDLNKFAN